MSKFRNQGQVDVISFKVHPTSSSKITICFNDTHDAYNMCFKSTYFLFTKNRCALSNRKLQQMLKLAKTWQAQQPQQSACLLMSS
jgi:predicted glycosyltransferase involved in capsule biosynthesis